MFTIGKLAGLTSVSNDTLRYYEQEGLIRPTAKSAAGYRLYDRDSARRIHFIKHAQRCGFTLAENPRAARVTRTRQRLLRRRSHAGDREEIANRKQNSSDESHVQGARSADRRMCKR